MDNKASLRLLPDSPNSDKKITETSEKALKINLDPLKYGSFAEIGAGQEVARNFFRAGAAAGTIAKTMSAYDMVFSDAIYGPEKSGRYVIASRLSKMLDKEYQLVIDRLTGVRPPETTFFAFADTCAAKSFKGNNECHAWMGIRYQVHPKGAPNDIILHVRMLDHENLLQQEAIGIVGVNLMYSAFYYLNNLELFVASLSNDLTKDRIEIDVLKFEGPDLCHIDNRLASVFLVRQGHTNAVIFSPNGDVLQSREFLHKKDVLVLRGSFRPTTHLNMDMFECGKAAFAKEFKANEENSVEFMEITLNNLAGSGDLEPKDFLARVDTLGTLGHPVLISNFPEYYSLTQYFRRYTTGHIGLIMGVAHLNELFDEKYYSKLEGGLLEAFGKLFTGSVRIYLYPSYSLSLTPVHENNQGHENLITAENYQPPERLILFYQFLLKNHFLEDLENFHIENLQIFSREVLVQIQKGERGWEKRVPNSIADMIKTRKLFGYQEKIAA